VRRVIEAAPSLGISTLTLYALSSDNFRRPPTEVSALLRLFAEYLERERRSLAEQGVHLQVIGRRDRLPAPLRTAIERAEQSTADGDALTLRLAIDYSARHEILSALARRRTAEDAEETASPFAAWLDVDLLVRTGGEQRLSDFMLWECAYAELWFTDRLWPDVTARDIAAAVDDFHRRDRRFGRISA
jgi:undecaprenyl diphosphate synthase